MVVTFQLGLLLGVYFYHMLTQPWVLKTYNWSIQTFRVPDAFEAGLEVSAYGASLTAYDVSDVNALFVADPFLVNSEKWYLFFEVWNAATNQGDIGLASSEDGLTWEYGQVVLDEPFHLSYPQVFSWNGQYYMTPESAQAKAVRLYRAIEFPYRWRLVAELVKERELLDPTVFRHDDRWWMFASTQDYSLHLFHADKLIGPWREHVESPVVSSDYGSGRLAGGVFKGAGTMYRSAQDWTSRRAKVVRAYEITSLTTSRYRERLAGFSPILQPDGSGWNADRIHHFDLKTDNDGNRLAAVDGFGPVTNLGHWIGVMGFAGDR